MANRLQRAWHAFIHDIGPAIEPILDPIDHLLMTTG